MEGGGEEEWGKVGASGQLRPAGFYSELQDVTPNLLCFVKSPLSLMF